MALGDGTSGINFSSMFGSDNPIGIGNLPSRGLGGLETLAGVDIPGFNDNVGSQIGSIAGMAIGSVIPGVGTVLGGLAGNFLGGFGGGMFGGGGHHTGSLPDFTVPANTPSIIDTPNAFRSFRGLGGEGGILTGQTKSIHDVWFPTFGEMTALGLLPTGEQDKLRKQYDGINTGGSSPGNAVSRNQQLANMASNAVAFLEQGKKELATMDAFLADNPEIKAMLDARMDTIPNKNPGESHYDVARYGRAQIKRDFFSALQHSTLDELSTLESNIGTPGSIQPDTPIEDLFGFGETLTERLAKGELASIGLPIDGSGGSGDDAYNQETQDYLAHLQRETELITAQQQDRALQQDENATQEERNDSALALLGLTSSFLINSLNAPSSDPRINTQSAEVSPSGSSGISISEVDSSFQRDTNVFQSPGFNFQKQGKSKRTDIPLDIIEENPSSFPRLAQIGQGGLVPNPYQDRGLLVN